MICIGWCSYRRAISDAGPWWYLQCDPEKHSGSRCEWKTNQSTSHCKNKGPLRAALLQWSAQVLVKPPLVLQKERCNYTDICIYAILYHRETLFLSQLCVYLGQMFEEKKGKSLKRVLSEPGFEPGTSSVWD